MRHRSAAGATEPDREPPRETPEPSLARVDYELLRRLGAMAHRDEAAGSPVEAQEGGLGVAGPGRPQAGEMSRDVTRQSPVRPREDLPRNVHVEVVTATSSEPPADPEEGRARVPKVVVVDRRGDLARDIGKAARDLVPEPEILLLDRPTQIVEIAEGEDPDVVVFSGEEVTTAGLRRLAAVHKAQPKVVILLSDNQKTWPAAQLAASGASDILPARPTRARLRAKLSDALSRAEQLRAESVVVTERVVVEKAEPAETAPAAQPAAAALGRVFTVASASGGSGKTMLATNLATYLAKATGGRVLLVDLDLQFGEVAPTLHLHPERTIEDSAKDPDELAAMVVEHASGFRALCAPSDPLAGERIGPEEVSAILAAARRQFDYVVVDTPPTLNETCLVAFDRSEKLLVTANMDVPSLKNMRRYLETLEKLDVTANRSVLVLNRVESGIGLDLKGVSQLFPKGFLAVLQVAKEVPWATNMGVPVLDGDPKAEISRRLAEGFAKLVPAAAGVTLPWSVSPASHRTGLAGLRRGRN
ncbi:MAG TPA: AAA family ATPase [Actinomycetota bacterium]|nr:AAA family ATPase [Actinomycetota bacterium]